MEARPHLPLSMPPRAGWFHAARCRNGDANAGVRHDEPAARKDSKGTVMKGLITSRDVVTHGFTIVRLWGFATYLRCLRAALSRRPTTFLAIVSSGAAHAPPR